MRHAIAALTILVTPGFVLAKPYDCENAVALAESAGAKVRTINGLAEACKGKVQSDASCKTFADLIKANSLGENMLAFSAQALLVAVSCPNSRSSPRPE